MTALRLQDVSIGYGGAPVVTGASFDVAEGESFALVGESGSGKSTVLKAIAGLTADWTGTIEVLGKPRGHQVSRTFARVCQMVFQDPYGSLHPRQTVDAVLSEPLAIHGLGDRDARVRAALEQVGLDARFRFRFPHQLSGGQRQRVAIARALMLEPRVLLLDEPTSALDVSVQAEILNLLKRLRADRGLTYVMVTHNLPVVGFLCDRMAVMTGGQIVEIAPSRALHDGAFDHPYSRTLYAASGGDRPKGTTMPQDAAALDRFNATLASAGTPQQAYDALYDLVRDTVGVRLMTVMMTDEQGTEGERAFSNMPDRYPVSGRKPLPRDRWFDTVMVHGEPFVANTIDAIDKVFPDADLIASLGCGAVVNLPVAEDGRSFGTINMLDAPNSYTPERVNRIVALLPGPSTRALRRAAELG